MDELKPCPCCGCGKVVIEQYKRDGLRIICKRCALKREQRVVSQTIEWLEGVMIKDWNTRADGWISVGEHPKCSGRYTVNSSYGVRDAFFSEGFIAGDFRWQDCETGNDEGVENHHGIEFEVYNWMPLPAPPKAEK